jgi:hypothetical protein
MDRAEKAVELVAKAERLGVRLDFDCNLLTATKAPSDDPGGQDLIIEELVKYIIEVRSLVRVRATSIRARYFFGQRIAIKDGLNLAPAGEGVLWGALAGAHGDGSLSISFSNEEWKQARTVTAKAEDLLMVVDGEADGASPVQNDESKSEQPAKGFFRRVRDGLR